MSKATGREAAATSTSVRVDVWLWAARFYRTRALAQRAIAAGHVSVGAGLARPARLVRPGDAIAMRTDGIERVVVVRALSTTRGPAVQAVLLYEETPESVTAREQALALRRLQREPAHALSHGRPTKRDRRALQRLREAPGGADSG